MTQRRVVNFRPLLFLTAALMAGIFACLFFLRNFSYFIWALATLAGMCLTAMLFKQNYGFNGFVFMLGFICITYSIPTLSNCLTKTKAMLWKAKSKKSATIRTVITLFWATKADGFAAGGKAVLRIEDEHPYKLYDRVKFWPPSRIFN